jgi:hypothetical protein
MWAKLVEIVETKWNTNQQPRNRLAKTVNTLYGAMNNCQFAFTRYENAQTALNFTNFVFALDALISTLQNVNSQVAIFDPELTEPLERYVLEEARMASIAQPRERVKAQLGLLRRLVHEESEVMEISMEEFASFSGAVADLGRFIGKNFTPDELFGAGSAGGSG